MAQDPEMLAMHRCRKALENLSPTARVRVATWLMGAAGEMFGPPAKPADTRQMAIPGSNGKPAELDI